MDRRQGAYGAAQRIFLLSALGAISLAAGCSSIVDTDRTTAEEARLTVTGTSPVPLKVITSTRFSVGFTPEGNEAVSYVQSDTVELTLPIDRRLRFGSGDRVHFTVWNPSEEATADIDVRVRVDGNDVFRQSATLRGASLSFNYFLF